MAEFRWRLDGATTEPQMTLFEDVPLRRVGRGEYRGLEFLEVKARTIINEIPSGPLPFRHTINAYRGCSHACVYCLAGDTPILMADGRTKLIADVEPGDTVVGTERRGSYRRFVPSDVLDRWSTMKSAYRIILQDGTTLVASEDHRFLSERGWKFVTGTDQGALRRPHLTLNNRLAGIGALPNAPSHDADSILGRALKVKAPTRVTAIEPLDLVMPMFDLTTTTSDFVANGVVSHNCFARPTHDYLGLGIGRDFDTKIVVKRNAVELAEVETDPVRWAGHTIAMGTNTDPYQAAEGKYRLTRGIVGVLAARANPFSILTKSTLVLRDVDLLARAAQAAAVRVDFSVGTLDEEVWRSTEPGTPHPRRRLEAVGKLNAAGVRSGVLMGPVLPGLSDREDQIADVVKLAIEVGAVSIGGVPLHLKPGVKEHYLAWLGDHHPELMDLYSTRYASRAYPPRGVGAKLSETIRRLVEQLAPPGHPIRREWKPMERAQKQPKPAPTQRSFRLDT